MNAIKEGVATSVLHNPRQGLGSTGSSIHADSEADRLGMEGVQVCSLRVLGKEGEDEAVVTTCLHFENRPCGLSESLPRLLSCEHNHGLLTPLFLALTAPYTQKVL